MGMFDRIFCECELPDGFNPKGIEFQTKNLERELNVYTITADGRLLLHYVEWESTPEDELPYPNIPIIGCMREKEGSRKLVEVDFHGLITFYGSNLCAIGPKGFATVNDEEYWSREYTAKFTNGKLESIVLDLETSDITKRGKHITRKEFHKR
jgi:hypothetical protein